MAEDRTLVVITDGGRVWIRGKGGKNLKPSDIGAETDRLVDVMDTLMEKGYKIEGMGCGYAFPPWAKSIEQEKRNCLIILKRE
jgi:hypothetical protein